MSKPAPNLIDLLTAFKKNIILFFDALIELLPNEGDFYHIRVLFEFQIPIETAIKIFSKRILPHAEMVLAKDERFFIETTDLFAGLRRDKVSYFKDLWQSGNLTDQDKEALWDWFTMFLRYANKYQELVDRGLASNI
jgi:hypothetical protein